MWSWTCSSLMRRRKTVDIMSKKGYYEYDPVIYPRKLWVHVGYDLQAIAAKSFEGVEPPEKEYYGVTYEEVTRKGDNCLGVLVSFQSTKDMTMGVCAHEASHACDYIEGAIGMEHGGEASAYLLGWIASCIGKARVREGAFIEVRDENENKDK